MGLIKEFKEFAVKGNAMDLAVGVVIGAAFGKIVSSLVGDVIMPLIGAITPGMTSFTEYHHAFDGQQYATLEKAREAGGAVLAWGSFLQVVFDFVIIAFSIFMVVKALNSMKRKEEEAPAAPLEPGAEEQLLTEIRDLLAQD